jgi:hypothetical protein
MKTKKVVQEIIETVKFILVAGLILVAIELTIAFVPVVGAVLRFLIKIYADVMERFG